MPLINCKVDLKLEWIKHCVLAAAGIENDGSNSNNIIFTIKDTKLYAPAVTLSTKDNQNLSNFLANNLKVQCIGMNIKQKMMIKIRQTSIDIFSNQTL